MSLYDIKVNYECEKCHEVLGQYGSGHKRLKQTKQLITNWRKAHNKKCTAKQHSSREGVCPICHISMRKDTIPRHCSSAHVKELIQSMTPSDFIEAKRTKLPIIFGYANNTRIISACLICDKGSALSLRDCNSIKGPYVSFYKKHAECHKHFDSVASHYDYAGPRIQLTNTVKTVKLETPEIFKKPGAPEPPRAPEIGAPEPPRAPEPPPDLEPLRNELILLKQRNGELQEELDTAREECLKAQERPIVGFRPPTNIFTKKTEKLMMQYAEDEGIYFEEDESKYEDICSYAFDNVASLKQKFKDVTRDNQKSEAIADEFRIIIHRLLEALADAEIPLRTALTATQESFLTNNL